jgi:hypothetical protein
MKKILSVLFLLVASLILFATTGKVTRIISLGSLKYQDIENSCKTILQGDGELLYFANNNAILVESTETNIQRVELLIKYAREELKKKETPSTPVNIPVYKVIPLGNVDFGSVDSNCRPWLSPGGKMTYSITNNAVVVTDTPKVIEAIEKFIAELSKATPPARYDDIQYSDPDRNDSNTIIIYSNDWGYPGWGYPGWGRPWRPPYRPYPPRPRPVPPHPPIPIPVPKPPNVGPGNRPSPPPRSGGIQQRPVTENPPDRGVPPSESRGRR